jgi:hypothetical protein
VVVPGAVLAVVFVMAMADSILTVAILLLIVGNAVRGHMKGVIIAMVHPARALVDFIGVHALEPRDFIR